MRTVQKGNTPPCLSQANRDATHNGRATTGNDWDGLLASGCKEELRQQLVNDQHGICVYCGKRIKPTRASAENPSGVRIEHWAARSVTPSKTFDWNNLFAACDGGEFTLVGQLHCDVARGKLELFFHPMTPELEKRFNYDRSTGKMTPSNPQDDEAQQDIDTLKLNTPKLMENRAVEIRKIQDQLRRDDSERNYKKLWNMYSPNEGKLRPYSFVIRQYLRPKLRAKRITVE